jgi:regulator of replication initiation timing
MDSIVSEIIQQYQIRAEFGEKKYGVTLDREDLSTLDWIEHAKQEAMDLTLYLEKLKKALEIQGSYNTTGKVEASHETKDRIIYNLNRVIMSQEEEIKAMNIEFNRTGLDFQGVANSYSDRIDKLLAQIDRQKENINTVIKEKASIEFENKKLNKAIDLLEIEITELKKENHTKKKRGWHF